MSNLNNYEQSRQILLSLGLEPTKLFSLINELNKEPDVTKEIIRDYEARFCCNHNIEVDLFDEEFGYITIAYNVFCENEHLAKEVTRLRVSRHEKYSLMELKDVYYVA